MLNSIISITHFFRQAEETRRERESSFLGLDLGESVQFAGPTGQRRAIARARKFFQGTPLVDLPPAYAPPPPPDNELEFPVR